MRVYVIAEAGVNHNGKLDLALKLCDAAKEAGVKIIGETSGGGTSPVGVYFDGLGTFFNLSNHYDMCYKDGDKYVHNDAGIPLDHPFPFNEGNWYDANAVNTFIKGL